MEDADAADYALADVERSGGTVRAGEPVLLTKHAANRDRRRPAGHLVSFTTWLATRTQQVDGSDREDQIDIPLTGSAANSYKRPPQECG